MSKGMGHQNVSPRKLVVGMKVVVWIKPEYILFASERAAGIVSGKWLKGTMVSSYKGGFALISINGQTISNIVKGLIIIRSVSRLDNLKPGEIRAAMSAAARKQRRELMSSVKVVRSEVK